MNSHLKSVIESLVFVSEAPLSLDRLATLLDEYDRGSIRVALEELRDDMLREDRGVMLEEVAGGWQMRSRPANADFLRRLTRSKPFRLSPSSLETLAIIAYRQPVTRAEIEFLRGVDAGGVLKSLMERKLVRILGRKDVPGRPLIYGTSREFLEMFSLKDLASLPTLKEIHDFDPASGYERQGELPLAEPAGTGDEPGPEGAETENDGILLKKGSDQGEQIETGSPDH